MNEYYAKLEIIGEPETLMQLQEQLFHYYSKDRVEEAVALELANPRRQNGIDYFRFRIERHKDESGGYYYLNLEVWEPIVGPEANVDLLIINERKRRVRIATRCKPDLDRVEEISAKYPDITFIYYQCREWIDGELICVIKEGKIVDWISGDCELTEEKETIRSTRTWSEDHEQSRIRQRVEILDENGQWVLEPFRIYDESAVYAGSAHDPKEDEPQVYYLY